METEAENWDMSQSVPVNKFHFSLPDVCHSGSVTGIHEVLYMPGAVHIVID